MECSPLKEICEDVDLDKITEGVSCGKKKEIIYYEEKRCL